MPGSWDATLREGKKMSLMEVIRRATLIPAQIIEEAVRDAKHMGRLQEGAFADVVVFDPNTIIDRATYQNPRQPSEGVRYLGVMPGRGRGRPKGNLLTGSRSTTSPVVSWPDVRRIRNHPLVPPDVPVYGYIYHVTTGCLVEVSEASEAGRAR